MRIPALSTLLLSTLLAVAATGCAESAGTQPPEPTTNTGVPAPPAWLGELERLYDRELRVDGLESRTFSPEQWWQVATPLLTDEAGFSVEQVGESAEGRPLRHVQWGNGPTQVLFWSQMHGNESTASMTLVDLFEFLGAHADHPLVASLHEQTTLHFLPVMNPDGAARFQRRNAHGIDINRDARALATPEGRTLKALRDRLEPKWGFNLHDQRPGYRAGDSDRGVAIALLAPPFDETRGINEVRGRAMHLAAVMRIALEPHIAGYMGRWSDTFNPRAFGDLMTAWGTSTVLVESGGIEGDPEKQAVRRLNFIALAAALDAIVQDSYAQVPQSLYTDLPENGRVAPDLLVYGATLAIPGTEAARADVLVDFQHPLAERGGRIVDIGDLAESRPRHRLDATGLYIVPIDDAAGSGRDAIATGVPARFHLSHDPEGRDIAWTLDEDVDPQHPRPAP